MGYNNRWRILATVFYPAVAEVHKEVKHSMNKYEVMYVIDAALEESARNELISHFSGIVEKNAGTIDRIDEWDEGGYLRVIDYKSAKKEIDPTRLFYGLQLQLMLYLQAAAQGDRDRKMADIDGIRAEIAYLNSQIDHQLQRQQSRYLRTIHRGLQARSLPPS